MLSSNATAETNKNSAREQDVVICERESNNNITGRLIFAVDQKLIKGFTPAYFGAVMGTGVSSCILYKFPYPSRGLEICGCIMFGIGVAFLLVTIVCFVASTLRYPKKIRSL